MDIIKLYQVDDWIASYLESWGYQDKKLVGIVYDEIKNTYTGHITPKDIASFLDKRVLSCFEKYWTISLSDTEKLNYFKMIFLLNKGYESCSLFDKILPKDETFLKTLIENNSYPIAPDIIPANMFRQSIKTFHPVWQLKKVVAKSVQKIVFRKRTKRIKNKRR